MMGLGWDWDNIDMFPLTPVVVVTALAVISATIAMDAEPRK